MPYLAPHIRPTKFAFADGRASAVYYDALSRTYATLEGERSKQWPDYGTAMLYDYEGRKATRVHYSFAPDRGVMQSTGYTYLDNGALDKLTVTQGTQTASAAYGYDNAGRVSDITYGSSLKRTMSYDVHGWLKSVSFAVPKAVVLASEPVNSVPSVTPVTTVHRETLYYADAASGTTRRYDGKIAARSANGDLTGYAYDTHGRPMSSTSVTLNGV